MHARLVSLVLLCSGCGSGFARAKDAFDHAEYPEARRRLLLLEPEYCAQTAERRAEYALYRGLTELSLGHVRFAVPWLGRAKWSLDHEPELFDAALRGRLLAAWQSLGRMPGEPPRVAWSSAQCAL